MKQFIIANITSYVGQCVEAEHYYCSYYKNVMIDTDKNITTLHCCRTSVNQEELYKELSEEDAKKLTQKDGQHIWRTGAISNRFNSFEEIHNELLKLYPDANIVSYHECSPFQEMLIRIDGEIKGINFLGEVWSYVPNGVYKDLLPKHFKIKCECGKEYGEDDYQDIMVEQNYGDRTIIIFDNDICDCCDRPYLMWNVIL